MNSLLFTVWLGWLIPCAGELGCPNCKLMRSRGSGRDILQQLRRWMKIQVCFLANLSVHSEWHRVWLLLFWVLQTQFFPTENVLWTHILTEWLGWPHLPRNRKKGKTPNITRHNMHLPCFLFKKKKKTKSAIKSVFFPLLRTIYIVLLPSGEQSSLVKKAKNANTWGQ